MYDRESLENRVQRARAIDLAARLAPSKELREAIRAQLFLKHTTVQGGPHREDLTEKFLGVFRRYGF